MLQNAGRRDTENVHVANKYVMWEVVRKLSQKMRRFQVVKHTKKGTTAGFACLVWSHCKATATWKEADCSSTVVQHSRHAHRGSVQEQPQMEQRTRGTE